MATTTRPIRTRPLAIAVLALTLSFAGASTATAAETHRPVTIESEEGVQERAAVPEEDDRTEPMIGAALFALATCLAGAATATYFARRGRRA